VCKSLLQCYIFLLRKLETASSQLGISTLKMEEIKVLSIAENFGLSAGRSNISEGTGYINFFIPSVLNTNFASSNLEQYPELVR